MQVIRKTALSNPFSTSESLVPNASRIDVADALRGFAVLAILLIHNVEHFIFPVYPSDPAKWLSVLDAACLNTVFSLFSGKAYAIFSLLFGFTFCLQYERQRQAGKDFGYRFLWRLAGLVLLATLNAAFFPGGDILLLYAITGILLFFVRNRSDNFILICAILFCLQPVEWAHYVMHLADPAYTLPNYGVDVMYAQTIEATKSGSFSDFFLCNLYLGQKASLLWAVNAGRACQTAGLFLLGLYIGRKQLLLPTHENCRIWTKILIAGALLSVPLFSLRNLIMEGAPVCQQTAGTAFDMWQKLAFSFVLLASFVLLYQSPKVRQRLDALRAYGKMSLTNYVSQSVLGAFIYFPIGLYLAPYCGPALSLVVGLLMFAAQLCFCRWWLKKHKHGPLEKLWREWTWLKK